MKKILAALIVTIVQSFGATTPSQVESITSVSSAIQTTAVENENHSKLYREKLAMIKANKEEGKFLCIASGVSTIAFGIAAYMLSSNISDCSNIRKYISIFGLGIVGSLSVFSSLAYVVIGTELIMDYSKNKQELRKNDSTNEKYSQNELATAILTTPL